MIDPQVFEVATPVVVIAALATLVAAVLGVPLGGLSPRGRGGRIIGAIASASTRWIAPLLVGLGGLSALTGSGLDLTLSAAALAVAHVSLGLMVVAGSTARAVRFLPPEAFDQLDALRLGRAHGTRLLLIEVWPKLVRAGVSAFAFVTAITGSVLMAGGRLDPATRIEMPLVVDESGRRPGLTAGLLLVGLSIVLAVPLLSTRRSR